MEVNWDKFKFNKMEKIFNNQNSTYDLGTIKIGLVDYNFTTSRGVLHFSTKINIDDKTILSGQSGRINFCDLCGTEEEMKNIILHYLNCWSKPRYTTTKVVQAKDGRLYEVYYSYKEAMENKVLKHSRLLESFSFNF